MEMFHGVICRIQTTCKSHDKYKIPNFMFTPKHTNDREPLKQDKSVENIKGKLCADKGYYRTGFV